MCRMLERGQILSGKYRLDAEIGRGGMGIVWRSTRLDLGSSVALKVMHAAAANNPASFERFSREARAAASLNSPHVVRVIDFGVDPTSHAAFIAMELLRGESLEQRLARCAPLPPAAVARVITQVARALSEAHAVGIVHRDLKPANIFLVENADDELVKLLDFGVAKAIGALGAGIATATGDMMGPPYYMSPEQVNSRRQIDHRTDLWSLGVIASECLTGRRPFSADTLSELAMKISLGQSEVPSSLGPVPSGFDVWFARATAIDVRERFQSATELAHELSALVARGPLEPAAPVAMAPTQRLADLMPSTAVVPGSAPSAPSLDAAGSSGTPASVTAPSAAPPPGPEPLDATRESPGARPLKVELSTTARGSALSTHPSLETRSGSRVARAFARAAALVALGVLVTIPVLMLLRRNDDAQRASSSELSTNATAGATPTAPPASPTTEQPPTMPTSEQPPTTPATASAVSATPPASTPSAPPPSAATSAAAPAVPAHRPQAAPPRPASEHRTPGKRTPARPTAAPPSPKPLDAYDTP